MSEGLILLLQALLLKRQVLQDAANVLRLRQYFDSYFPSAVMALAESTTSITLTKEKYADIFVKFER